MTPWQQYNMTETEWCQYQEEYAAWLDSLTRQCVNNHLASASINKHMSRTGPRPNSRRFPDAVDNKLFNDWMRARAQAHFRSEVWMLTEQEYIDIWRQGDMYKLKGRGSGAFCLVRIDLEKGWDLDNVEIRERIRHFRRCGGERRERCGE
jgi:hypothetical protein